MNAGINDNEDECEQISAPVPCMLAYGQNALLVNLGKLTVSVAWYNIRLCKWL